MRRFLLPLLFLVVGIEAGILLDHFYLWRRSVEPAPAAPPVAEAPASPAALPDALACEASATFSDNIYPSLLLSFGTAYPEYARCLTIVVSHAPVGKSCQIRVASNLFQQPLVYTATTPAAKFDLNPDLPWNYEALRKVTQLEPELFVVSVTVNGETTAQTTLTCMVHPVNEVVARVFDASTGEWQDTSVCFAAFVNEDNPWINSILQEAIGRGVVPRFAGYEFGPQGVVQQIQAVWETLAAHGFSYIDMATTSGGVAGVATQYVRFIGQTTHDQGANCADASALLASIFRRIGLRPVLIFRPGHCFVAVYDAAQGGHLIALETTLLGPSSFASAMTYGAQELQSALPNMSSPGYSSVDIALARQEGITPIAETF